MGYDADDDPLAPEQSVVLPLPTPFRHRGAMSRHEPPRQARPGLAVAFARPQFWRQRAESKASAVSAFS